ncbi:MAG: hypothetical protein WAU65_01900 [Candidatus Nanoarchaeia archaeon]
MKKSVLVLVSIVLSLFIFPLIFADINATQISNGLSCLINKTTSCGSLTTGEQIFTSLASGQCTDWISNSSNSNGCYPSGSCDIKTTAQAVLALRNAGLSTNQSATWLLSQQQNTSNLNWFLQIDSNNITSCNISYSGVSYTMIINPYKTISSGNLGNGLTVPSSNPYWLLISPSYYGIPFSISCNQSFTTTNLYQRQGLTTIYVSGTSASASSKSTLVDSVNSSCFGSFAGSCDYEATLWTTLALSSLNDTISPYLPYLTALASDSSNQKYLPYAFLYAITSSSDDLQTLFSNQVSVNGQNYWQMSGDSYYDTALALFSTSSQSSDTRNNAINWLMSVQGPDGCWNSGNILDTAFVLYSLEGTLSSQSVVNSTGPINSTNATDCISSGYYCLSGTACNQAGGSMLSGYNCNLGISICCSKQLSNPSCSAQGGQICSSNQSCTGGSTSPASDTSSCCLGICATQQATQNDCLSAGGVCRSSCLTTEQPSPASCGTGSYCCVPGSQPASNSNVWIWVLAILIVLLVIAILSRKQLRMLWIKMKSGKNKGGQQSSTPPRGPPFFPSPTAFQRGPQPQPSQRTRQQPSEVNDVLKKLKDMGK